MSVDESEDKPTTSCVIEVVGIELSTMREEAKRRAARLLGASPPDLYAELLDPLTVVQTLKWTAHMGQPQVPLRWMGSFCVQVDPELAAQEDTPVTEDPDLSNITPFRRRPPKKK